jgi:DNA-binding GntR family transcriptional regulator
MAGEKANEMTGGKTHHAYDTIRTRILAGTYAPTQRLIVRTLAEELAMSPVPIREALRRLEAEGWVVIRPNIGAEVRPVDAGLWVAAMDTLALVEGHATALAAPSMGSDDLARARAANERMRSALEGFNAVAAAQANQDFHAVFLDRCPSPYLVDVVKEVAERIGAMLRTVFVFVPDRTWAALAEHERLVELVESGADPEEVERFARQHKLRTVAAYLNRDEEGLPELDLGTTMVREALLREAAGPGPATILPGKP